MSQLRGRPFQANTFGQGRPKGSRNKTTKKMQELLLKNGELLIQKSISSGPAGR
jgi:hypothetical protein